VWDERELIETCFAPLTREGDAALGLCDDSAILSPPADGDLALTVDTITCGVHYLPDDPPDRVAQKLVRVNLSDLAAMGARPIGYLLGSAFARDLDGDWVARFAEGLARDQAAYDVALLGGDTTATPGPSSLTLTAVGAVPRADALRRSGARAGDTVCVSGTIGDAGLGLRLLSGDLAVDADADAAFLAARYQLPEPRVALGRRLREQRVATAAIDVSDGLVADVAHLAAVSGVAIELDAGAVPVSDPARHALDAGRTRLDELLTSGDDYELAFTVPAERRSEMLAAAAAAGADVTAIGMVREGQGITIRDEAGAPMALDRTGWRHR